MMMRFPLRAGARGGLLAVTIGLVLTAASACGSSGQAKSSPAASSPAAGSPASSSAPATQNTAAAQALIKSNWVAFFNPKTTVSRRLALLENGQAFESVIRAQAGSPLAAASTATVSNVALTSPTEANVTYTILLSGKPALPNQAGKAIYQRGTWKVADSSFCGLLTLENGGKTTGLPAACKAGG